MCLVAGRSAGGREESGWGWAHVDSGPEPGEVEGVLSRRPKKSLAAGSLEAKWVAEWDQRLGAGVSGPHAHDSLFFSQCPLHSPIPCILSNGPCILALHGALKARQEAKDEECLTVWVIWGRSLNSLTSISLSVQC